jgi:outer membrane protein assembly factor BamB
MWNYTTYSYYSSPAVADGKVYVGSENGGVYCLNATTGAYIWSYPTGGEVSSSPAVADGKLYVGSEDFNVYCLNATTGAYIWSYPTGDRVMSSPAVADGKVYVGSTDMKVWCLNASSASMISYEREIWNYTTGWLNDVRSSPAVADGKVYVGSFDHKVYCLNASTGAHIWGYKTGDYVSSSPAVADGRVYVGSYDGKVYAFGPDTTLPNITDVSQFPFKNNVTPEDDVQVNATVTDDLSGVKQVTLNYTNGNGTWINVDMTNLEGNVWNVTIPKFPYCTNVTYAIMAEDNANNTITTEEMGYEYKYHVIPELPSSLILPLFMIVTLLVALLWRRRH